MNFIEMSYKVYFTRYDVWDLCPCYRTIVSVCVFRVYY